MAELASCFETAQSNIEPSKDDWDNAPDAHQDIADILAADETLKKWGINPILIGSYGRQVSIRRVYDVDMFCRLDEYPDGVSADDILDQAYSVLLAGYDDDEDVVKREDRSVTVLVRDADGLYVDVVPARKAGAVWEIPTEDDEWIAGCPRCRHHVIHACQHEGFEPTIAFETDNFAAVVGMVAAGLGVTILPRLALETTVLPVGAAVRPTNPRGSRDIYVVTPRDLLESTAVGAMMDAVTRMSGSPWQLTSPGERATASA